MRLPYADRRASVRRRRGAARPALRRQPPWTYHGRDARPPRRAARPHRSPALSAAPWHAAPPEEVLERLASRAEGLTTAEAGRRLAAHGPNQLLVHPPRSAWAILRDQLRSLIVALLAAAALVSWLLLGDLLDAAAIAVVLGLNVGIGFTIEWKARRSMEALRSLEVPTARVLRDGAEPAGLDARELVPGDVVSLEAGDAVPADLRLLGAVELEADEAPLTGESFPVAKDPAPVADDALLAERHSLLHKGTLVTAGSARGVVVATGTDTEVGRVSELVQGTEDDATPLERRLDALGRRLVVVALAVALLVSLLGWLRGGDAWLMLETGIALAVAAVPEGLPVVATITLAVGMQRMARRRALVRRLPSVESLGAVTVVCTDKTGTLTAGAMTVTVLDLPDGEVAVSGTGYGPEGVLRRGDRTLSADDHAGLAALIEVAALCNRAAVERREGEGGERWIPRGDPTEAALLALAAKAGRTREELLDRRPERAEVPFSSERLLMATFHALDGAGGGADEGPGGRLLACVKGAPERVLELCTSVVEGGGSAPLDEVRRAALAERNQVLASRGLRVLALARRELAPSADRAPGEDDLTELTFLGLVGFSDPPAEGVAETVARFRRAGLRTVMITGDQPATAAAVARELGVLGADDEVVDGRRLGACADDELADLARRATVFSRTAPTDKLRIVQGLRAAGEVVGMLGDGVNDAAALKGADVGVAMGGRGTEVAKETADVVLADDQLATVAVAVEGGRVIDDDIRKVIDYLFSCNLSEILVLLSAGLLGVPLPLLPLQILWLNLVTDVFPALALAMEPGEPDVMERPPADPRAPILSRAATASILTHAALLTAPVLAVYLGALQAGAGPAQGLEAGPSRAGTLAFLALALGQIVHALNVRSARPVLFDRRVSASPWLRGALVLCLVLTALALWLPGLAEVLELEALSASELALAGAAGLVPLAAGQALRWLRRRRPSGIAA